MIHMLKTHVDAFRYRARSEEGATAVEYGIMVTLIAVVIIVAVIAIGNALQSNFDTVADCLADTDDCPSN